MSQATSSFRKKIHEIFEHQKFLLILTIPLSWVYGWMVRLRNVFYRYCRKPFSLPGYTISVGNITLGGTGKTPIVRALAQYLYQHGAKPAILTRGYGSHLKASEWGFLFQGKKTLSKQPKRRIHLDEPSAHEAILGPDIPIIFGANRIQAALWFLDQNPQTLVTHWILEDGFQHHKIHADLSWVLLDQKKPLGSGRLLPAGSLREPLSALKRAHRILWTKVEDLSQFSFPPLLGNPPQHKIVFHTQKPYLKDNPKIFLSSPCVLMTGIARPEKLMEELFKQQIQVVHSYLFADHEPFSQKNLKQEHLKFPVLTTTKDFYRDPDFFSNFFGPLYLVDIEPLLPPDILIDIPLGL